MIDKATVQRIKDVADIVEVVSDYVHLTRRGANYMGLCPFHNERTPSFSVNRRRNFCYCFSCHKGGSPVNFIMEKEGISYHDALLQLAKKYGIKVEERELTDEEKEARTERESLMVASERAMRQMEQDLRETQEGRDVGLSYLYSRGVTEEAIKAFHLGYALDRGDHLTPLMKREGYDLETLRKLGLTGISQQGREYDKYRGRVIFPVMNSSGKVVAFGGRDLKGGPAKYINSPESILYKKSNELYGIFQAKSEIVRQDKCYLVEGYLDVIGMWMSGMQNVVASSGTALTDGQIAVIHRFTNNITLIYDGDKAGIKAALRGVDMLLRHKLKVNVLVLPDGDDPDSFAKKHTPEEFREYIAKHETDVIRFKTHVLMQESGDNPQQRAFAINSIVQSLACIPDDMERTVYVGECSRLLGVDEETVSAAVSRARVKVWEVPSPQTPPSPEPQMDAQLAKSIDTRRSQLEYPLRPIEKNLIDICIRYGCMALGVNDAAESDDEAEEYEPITVVEFIREEMEADGQKFTVPEYERMFTLILCLIEDYEVALNRKRQLLSEEINKKRDEAIREIAERGLTIAEIEREERLLEERLKREMDDELFEFSRHYPGDVLASHEDAAVRKMVNEVINDKYVLSTLYTKEGMPYVAPEKNLDMLVPRAVNELKSEILNLQVRDLQQQLAALEESGDTSKMADVMGRLHKMMYMRSRMAKDIGERIVCARSRNNK